MREAALIAFGVNLLMIVAAIVSIMVFIPKGKMSDEPREAAASPQPAAGSGART